MFSSVTETNSKTLLKTALIYLLISVFCALFGAVYEIYSHEVYSFYMIFAFVFPLIGGALPFLILALTDKQGNPGTVARNLYHSGIATLTVGSIVRGVLEIYGTTNRLTSYYWPIGFAFCLLGVVIYLMQFIKTEDVRKG